MIQLKYTLTFLNGNENSVEVSMGIRHWFVKCDCSHEANENKRDV